MRKHYFSVALADATGRVQTSTIMHKHRTLSAPALNAALEHSGPFQPVAVISISYLGKMSEPYFGTGTKKWVDHAGIIGKLLALAALASIATYLISFAPQA